MKSRHHKLTLPNVISTDRIVHGVTTLTCALQDPSTITCNNQLAAIQAIHQAIQQWAKPAQPVSKVTNPPPMRTQQRSILHPMRHPTKDQPQDLLPRVVIQKPNASPSTPTAKSTKDNYEPVARQRRSRVPHTVDPPPPRVNKSTDIGPISRITISQTAATANIITPSQAAKRRYPDQFLHSLAMPVLEKPQGNYYNNFNHASTRSLLTYGTHPMPMNSDDYSKELAKDQKAPGNNK